jgi:choline-sulfatase
MHFVGPDQFHGFEKRLTTDIYPSSFAWTPDWTRGAYPNPGSSVEQLHAAGKCTWSMQLDYDEEVTFRALESLRDFSRRPANEAFFLCASYTHPHDPFIINDPWWSIYDSATVDLPTVPARRIEDLHPYNQWLQIHHRVPEFPPDEASIRNARRAYYGMVSYFDHQVGLLVNELDRLGLRDDTVIVVTSDHGEMLGEHGMWFKRTFYDPSVRVPLLISGGPVSDVGARPRHTVSLVDLFPTFLDLAGLKDREDIEASLPGHSLIPLTNGSPTNNRHCEAIIEYFSEGVCQPMRSVVRDGLKFVYVHEEENLLFDLLKDPLETVNRVRCPEYAKDVASLKSRVFDGWDPTATRERVVTSQQRRHWIREIFGSGASESWDVKPTFDSAAQYVRGYDAQETSKLRRFPPFQL